MKENIRKCSGTLYADILNCCDNLIKILENFRAVLKVTWKKGLTVFFNLTQIIIDYNFRIDFCQHI